MVISHPHAHAPWEFAFQMLRNGWDERAWASYSACEPCRHRERGSEQPRCIRRIRLARAQWPIRKLGLRDEVLTDDRDVSTVDERIALVAAFVARTRRTKL
jgi:hypothetical protein